MKPIIELVRLEENEEFGTFGVLKINKEVFCVTLEPGDLENKWNRSSIPAQQYICRLINSPMFGRTFEITNVPDRDHVLFHAGNRVKDTLGCVLLAQFFGKLKGDRAVLNSGATFERFMQIMAGIDEFHLTVQEVF